MCVEERYIEETLKKGKVKLKDFLYSRFYAKFHYKNKRYDTPTKEMQELYIKNIDYTEKSDDDGEGRVFYIPCADIYLED